MLNEFEPETIDWCSYQLLLDSFFRSRKVDNIDEKIQLLRTFGGRRIKKVLSENRLVQGDSVTGKENQVFDILGETFFKPNEIWKKRSEFSSQIQGKEETGAKFLGRIRALAKGCEFREESERICDQFMAGLRSESLRNRLLAERPRKLTTSLLTNIVNLWESSSIELDFEELQNAVLQLCTRSSKRRVPRSQNEPETQVQVPTAVNSDPNRPKIQEIENTEDNISKSSRNGQLTGSKSPRKEKKSVTAVKKAKKRSSEIRDTCAQSEVDQASLTDGKPLAEGLPAAAKKAKRNGPKKRGRPPSSDFIPGGKRYKCKHCDYMSDVRRSLVRHERTHTNDRPYKCQYCELRFREKHHLQNHERVHTGETPYICEYCGRGFSKSSTLTDHVRTHTRETPHLCEFCGRGFIQKSALNTHKLIHTGNKPHSCNVCQRGFTTSNLLRNHMKTHAIRTADKEGCSRSGIFFPTLSEEPYPVTLCMATYAEEARASKQSSQGTTDFLECQDQQNSPTLVASVVSDTPITHRDRTLSMTTQIIGSSGW